MHFSLLSLSLSIYRLVSLKVLSPPSRSQCFTTWKVRRRTEGKKFKEKEMKLFPVIVFFLHGCCLALTEVNVMNHGARADGRSDDTKAFMEAWKAACGSSGAVKLMIPRGNYLVGPLLFNGPCKDVSSLRMELQGTLKATTELRRYKNTAWVQFGWVNGLSLIGGVFDGQGAASWPYNNCPKQIDCKVLPTNIMFVNMVNTHVKGITSLNSKFFHVGILGCADFRGSDIAIGAPADSPNTDGIHMERSRNVTISRAAIGTGDDCVSVGQGNSDIVLAGIRCGPGHGISVGSLGRYRDEGDVRGLVVRDCTLTGTTYGVRIKTWQNSPTASAAANMTFENIVMNGVGKPILIDQEYCPYPKCDASAPSRVKISNIKFKDIRGSSTQAEAVALICSKGMPCKDVALEDVSLSYVGPISDLRSTCLNVRPSFSGTQNPPPCQIPH